MAATMHNYKMQFAALLHRVPKEQRRSEASSIIKQIIGKETASQYPIFVVQISEEWPFDEEVVAELDRLDTIPKTKEQILCDVYEKATARFGDERVKQLYYRLYTDIMGWTRSGKEPMSQNEMLAHLQALHNAVTNPTDT